MATKFLNIIMLCFYGWLNNCYTDNLQSWDYESLVNRITSEFIAEMRRDLQLTPTGRGGSMPEDVESISIDFHSKRSADINDARRIAVLTIDRFKKKVNSCQKLRPYLREYPFQNTGAEISLYFLKDPQRNPEEGIDAVLCIRENLCYYRYSDDQPGRSPFYREPYEQALAIVQKKYPADFPPSESPPKLEVSLNFTDTRDLPFDCTPEAKKAQMKANFIVPVQELDELAVLGLQATHSKNLSAILRDLTRDIVAPYFDEAFLQRVHTFQLEHPNGEYIEYWGNGQMKFRGYFKEGLPDQHFHGWYSTGLDAFKGFFENGHPVGIHIAFFPFLPRAGSNPNRIINPSTALSFSGRILAYNQNGQLHGTQNTLYPPSELISVVEYVNGLLDGRVAIWQGKEMVVERHYKKGQLVTPNKSSAKP